MRTGRGHHELTERKQGWACGSGSTLVKVSKPTNRRRPRLDVAAMPWAAQYLSPARWVSNTFKPENMDHSTACLMYSYSGGSTTRSTA